MKLHLQATALLAITAAVAPACLTPNVFCYAKTYQISGMFQGTIPLDADLDPIEIEPLCADATTFGTKDLSGLISVMNQEFAGSIQISDQYELKRLDEMMTAIEAGAGSTMSIGHRESYADAIEAMISQMHGACTERLTDDYVNCTGPSATSLCNAYVAYPAQARYLDLDLGQTYERPASYNSDTIHKGGGGWCHYYYDWDTGADPGNGTESDPGGSSSTSTTGVGEAGSSETSGADESSGGEGAGAPFGDLDELVHCNTAHTACTYEPQLVDNIVGALEQIAGDDEAVLRFLVPGDRDFPGVRLEGFDPGEASTELAAAAGLENGDVIRTVDGTTLDSAKVLVKTVQKLIEEPAATLTYERRTRTRELRIEPK